MLETATNFDVLKECKQLQKEGRLEFALQTLQEALRRNQLPTSKFDAAGRFLRKSFQELETPTLKVHIIGQCTTSWLTTSLTTQAWKSRVAVEVTDGEYDAIIQDLSTLQSPVDVLVLLPWNQRLLADGNRSHEQRISDELTMLRQAWSMVPNDARLVQIGYDWMGPGAQGYQAGRGFTGTAQLVRKMNDAIVEALPDDVYFVDLEQVSGHAGRRHFYDARNYKWTKQPFSVEGVHELTRHLFAASRTLTTGPKKVLVLDLDNTLWGGVVGETGPLGIELGESPDGEAFRDFQSLVKQLKERGIVLAICSKNNADDAREPFEINRDMVLSLDDIAGFEASWDPKPMAIERLASTLKLGLDSFVFFDDNPAEREAVRQQLPMVEVVEVPTDPADYVSTLQEELWFETTRVSQADRERAEQYCVEQNRRRVQSSASSLPEYLTSLEMTASIRSIDETDMQRVAQLLKKTNQFNLTTRRHTADRVRDMLSDQLAIGLTLRLTDRFGAYGLVSIVIGQPSQDAGTLHIDTWLMSCRAIGRTVEDCLMNSLVDSVRQMGYERITAEYLVTAKNAQVADFFPRCGFAITSQQEDGSAKFELDLTTFDKCRTYVKAEA